MKNTLFARISRILLIVTIMQAGSSHYIRASVCEDLLDPNSADNLKRVEGISPKRFGRDLSHATVLGRGGEVFYVGSTPQKLLAKGVERSLRAVYCNATGELLAYVDPTSCNVYMPKETKPVTVKSTKLATDLPKGGQIEVVQAKDLSEAKQLLTTSISDRLVVIPHSPNPAVGLAKLSEVPRRLIIMHDNPETPEEIANVHPGADTSEAKWEIKAGAEILATLGSGKWNKEVVFVSLRGALSAREIALATINRKRADDLVLMMGCNHDGRLMFHDKTSVSIAELGDAWPVGCKTGDHTFPADGQRIATFRRISYREAGYFIKQVVQEYSTGQTRGEILFKLQQNSALRFWIPLVIHQNKATEQNKG